MKKNRNPLMYAALSVMFAVNVNSTQMVHAQADTQNVPSPSSASKIDVKTEAFKQFQQLVQQQKYDEAITVLRVVHKLDTISMLKVAMLLDDREQARAIYGKMLEKYPPAAEERNGLYDYAIQLSQGQHFSESITILRSLYLADASEKRVVNDYIVVLNWSGNNRSAIEIYENNKAGDMPSYVVMSAAGAYYQLGDYKKAQALFHEIGSTGDRKARTWEAQAYYRLGEVKTAESLYTLLLSDRPGDVAVLRSRASMLMISGQYRDALAEFEKILAAVAGTSEEAAVRKAVDYDKAIAHIRLGEEDKAVVLLKPYVDAGTADIFMQSDYILALRLNRDYQKAIAEAKKLWPDYGNVPVFGLQAFADSYVRKGEVQKAIPIYEHILQRDANLNSAKLGLAFASMMSGDIDKGLKVYDQLLAVDATLVDIALDDAYYFNENGHYVAGEKLFNLVISRYPDRVLYRQEFAASMLDNDMPRTAYKQYEALSTVKGGEAIGLAGMTRAAVQVGDYNKAKRAVARLQDQYAADPLTLQAAKEWEDRRIGQTDASFTKRSDYKGIDTKTWQLTGEQNIGGSFYALANLTSQRITDKHADPLEKTTVNSQSAGLGYKGIKNDAQAWFHNYKNNGTFNGYSLITNHYPTDRLTIGFDVTRTPLLDVQALNPVLAGLTDSRIMTTNYTLRTSILDGEKNTYSASVTRSFYSDDNQVNSYNADWTRTLTFNDKKHQYFFVFWSRDSYSHQRGDLYESPPVRDGYGVGLNQRWLYPKHYWDGTLALGWGRDRPEPTNFEPYARLEYGYNFSETRSLVAGFEYGLRTDRLNNVKNLNFGYRQYDILYRFGW